MRSPARSKPSQKQTLRTVFGNIGREPSETGNHDRRRELCIPGYMPVSRHPLRYKLQLRIRMAPSPRHAATFPIAPSR